MFEFSEISRYMVSVFSRDTLTFVNKSTKSIIEDVPYTVVEQVDGSRGDFIQPGLIKLHVSSADLGSFKLVGESNIARFNDGRERRVLNIGGTSAGGEIDIISFYVEP